jgi:PTH2 family peptidyl-tRNA hydrolase
MMPVEHNPYDNEALAKLRTDQKDPLVAYLVVRTDLEMGVGKVAAQCSHASDMMVLRLKEQMRARPEQWDEHTRLGASWLHCSFRKLVKEAKNQSQFDKLKEELDVFVVRDAGLTEVDMGTETVLCTWPMHKSQTPKRLVRMRLL